MSNGINQIGVPKFQHPWRSLQTSRSSGTWGNRGKGNEIQSTLENVIDFFTDISGKQKQANKEKGIITGTAPIPTFRSIPRSLNPSSPMRSTPIMDLFRLQFPSFKTGKLGYGHYYRAVGNKVKNIKNGIIPPKNSPYNKENTVYWAKDEPLREYTKNSALLVRYNANGPYKFGVGNFQNPVSSVSNPITLDDPNVTLFARYPFTSWYKKIPKTEQGFKQADLLGKFNTYLETPVRRGVKLYLGKKAYDYVFDNNESKVE